MKTEEKIAIAEEAYLRAVGVIKSLFNIKHASKALSREYTDALFHFESAIQGVLLYTAIDIGELTDTAKTFITGITIAGDIMPTVNGVGPRKLFRSWVPLSWDNVCSTNMPADKVKESIQEAIGVEVQSFVFPLAGIDTDIKRKSFSKEISEYVRTIIHVVSSPDVLETRMELGNTPEAIEYRIDAASSTLDALDAGLKVFNDAFLVYWAGSEPID